MTCRRFTSLIAIAATMAALCLFGCSSRALATEPEVDRLALAAVLIDGGDGTRALAVLREIDLEEAKATTPHFDFQRYYTLEGVAALSTGDAVLAVRSLRHARLLTQTAGAKAKLSVSIAKAYAAQQLWRHCLDALDAAGALGRAAPEHFLLRAKAHRELGSVARAIRTYRVGARRFPSDRRLVEGEIFLLLDNGLVQEALEWSAAWRESASETELLRLAAAMLRAGDRPAATLLAEQTLLRFPASTQARVLLGHAAATEGAYATAASHFKRAADLGGTATSIADAAEMYRRAGRHAAALRLGARIDDPVQKARQRFGILLEEGRFVEATAMEPRLSRLNVIADDEVKLALAYCWLQQAALSPDRAGPLAKASGHLRRIFEPAAFRQATKMHEAIEACRGDLRRCP